MIRRNWRGAIGVLISGALVWWLVAGSGIDWPKAWQYIREANPWFLLLSSATATSIFAIRVPRWRVILGDVGRDVPFRSLWEPIVIGQMVTNVIPLRPGELARAFTVSRKEPSIEFSRALGSIFIDRVFDGIAVLLLLAASVLDPAFPAGATVGGARVSRLVLGPLLALIVGLMGVYALAVHPDQMLEIYHRVARRLFPRFEAQGAAFLTRFGEGLSVVRNPGRFLMVFLWAVLHWLACALSYWFAFQAFGIQVPISAALFVQGIIVLAVAAPSTPGFVGVLETGALLSLAVYGVDTTRGAAFALAYHAVTFAPVTILGLIYVFRMKLHFSDFRTAGKAA